jgi:transposase
VPTQAGEAARGAGPSPPRRPCRSAAARQRRSRLPLRQGWSGRLPPGPGAPPVAGQRRASGGPAWPGGRRAEADGAVRARRDPLEAPLVSWHPTPAWAPVVARPGWLGGVAVPTSFGWRWRPATGIASPGHGRAWPGLVAGEQSSGGRPSQGWITTTGNRHTRRLLVEAAWQHRNPLGPASSSGPATPASRLWSENAPTTAPPAAAALVPAGRPGPALHHQRGRGRPRARRMALEPGRPGA